jgi:hypothetical protein
MGSFMIRYAAAAFAEIAAHPIAHAAREVAGDCLDTKLVVASLLDEVAA